MTRCLAVVVVLLGLSASGCGTNSANCGGSCAADQVCDARKNTCVPRSSTDDMPASSGADLSGSARRDLSQPDMTVPSDVDMTADVDLAMDVDLAIEPDMTELPDLTPGLAAFCMMAPMLTFVNNQVMASGDTAKTVNHTTSAGCGGITGPDQVYVITLAQTQELSGTVTTTDAAFDPVLSVRTVCDSEMPADELGCSEVGPGMAAAVDLVLPPGTYYVWVDGYAGSSGKYTLDLKISPPPSPPANDTCMAPIPLVFNMNVAAATGDLRAAKDDALGSCGGMGGADAVYTFTTKDAQSLTAVVTPDLATRNYQPAVYVRKACASALLPDELACDAPGGGAATGKVSYLPPGTYFIWVDGGATPGKFTLDVKLGPPPPANDTCAMPTTLPFVNGAASVSVDTTFATDDAASNGCGGSGPDVVYTFTLAAPQLVVATVTPDAQSAAWDPVVYFRKVCGDGLPANELGCKEVGPAMATAARAILPAGTYFLWVDGFGGSFGSGSLSVAVSTPPPVPANDTCAAAAPITLGQTLMGDTTSAADDLGAAISVVCDVDGLGSFPGEDVVYSFRALANGTATITLKSDGTWDPVLWISPGMCTADGSTCMDASDNPGVMATETIPLATTAGTTYYLVVDSTRIGNSGPFTISVQ